MATVDTALTCLTAPNTIQPDQHVGRLVGQFRIEELMGYGGMGAVYRGTQLSVDRPVAIKLIAGDTERFPEYLPRFRREAQAMAKLRHPNTVRLLDFGVSDEGRMFLVMELLRGDDLEQRLQKHGRLELTQALRIARQIAQSLSEAHALGIVHRDLKPGNVFLSHVEGGDSFVKVMDFGVAGFAHDGSQSTLTMEGAVVGTAAYMSPEQAQGFVVDARADLYSLGVVLFEMLTGRLPFQANTAVSLMIAHVHEQPPRLLEVRPDAPDVGLAQPLLDKLLAKAPDERLSSAADVINVVDALLLEIGAAISGPTGIDDLVPPPKRHERRAGLLASSLLLMAASTAVLATWQNPQKLSMLGVAGSQLASLRTLGADAATDAAGRTLGWIDRIRHATPVSVTIATLPAGASVRLSGAELGKTPYQLQLKRRTEVEITLPGHVSQTLAIDPGGEPNLVVRMTPLPPRRSPQPATR